jgi:hypothetical protein
VGNFLTSECYAEKRKRSVFLFFRSPRQFQNYLKKFKGRYSVQLELEETEDLLLSPHQNLRLKRPKALQFSASEALLKRDVEVLLKLRSNFEAEKDCNHLLLCGRLWQVTLVEKCLNKCESLENCFGWKTVLLSDLQQQFQRHLKFHFRP